MSPLSPLDEVSNEMGPFRSARPRGVSDRLDRRLVDNIPLTPNTMRDAHCRFRYGLPVPSFNRAQVRRRRRPDAGVELAQHRRTLIYNFQ